MTKQKQKQKHGHTREELHLVLDSGTSSMMRQAAIKLIMLAGFDYSMGLLILLNVWIMIIETDNTVSEKHSTSDSSSWIETCGWVALSIFVLELLLRMFAMRSIFWKDAWNIADFLIVTIDAAFSLIGLVVGDLFPISILRIFRLAKLARISKLFRVFPELRVLMAGLTGSARAIFWGMVLLVFVLLVWAMIAVLFIHPLAKNLDFDDCARCPQAYDSVARAMLTFWQQIVAGDSWGAATIPVIEAYPSTVLFFIPMFMMVGMAVMNLILGVVVEVALTAKAQIEDEDRTEKTIERMEVTTHLMDLCQHLDTDHEGDLSKEEAFQKFLEPGEFRDSVLSLDVTEEDFSIVWSVVDADKMGKVPYKELISRLYSIKSSDTQFMLSYIKFYITIIRNDLLDTMRLLEAKVMDEIKEVEDEVQNVESDIQKGDKHQEETREDSTAKYERPERLELCEPQLRAWQVLEQTVQKIPAPGDQELSLANETVNSSHAPIDTAQLESRLPVQASIHNGLSAASTNVTKANGVWDSQLFHDIEALQFELKQTLMTLTQGLQSQVLLVSTMNSKMSMKASDMSLSTI